jgi:transposase
MDLNGIYIVTDTAEKPGSHMVEPSDRKQTLLKQHGCLHAKADQVQDALFSQSEFFDPRDLVQVRYEMLRRVRIDGISVTEAARQYGFSRVAFYHALAAFARDGIPGLFPQRRGPKHAHKLTDAIVAFMAQAKSKDPNLPVPELAKMVRDQFGLSIHPRSIERALSKARKRGRVAPS